MTDDLSDERSEILTDDRWPADIQIPALILAWCESGRRTRRRGDKFVQVPVGDLLALLRWALARTKNEAMQVALADARAAMTKEMGQ